MASNKNIRVRVDQAKCQGHNRCHRIAPTLFELDELGHSREIGGGEVPVGLEQKALLARANCPEFAIEIIEE